ncbi:Mitochondrial GTPase 1, partial [Coemansia sp. RSA 1933]
MTIKQLAQRTAAHWRSTFTFEKTINWFPGHMAKGVKQMRDQLRAVDLVVETRDARIPLSSINQQFEDIVGKKSRLIVYNKSDLAPVSVQAVMERELRARTGHPVLFTDAIGDNSSVRRILTAAVDNSRANPTRYASQYTIMVVGMPNVGKSSLINALRRVGVGRKKAALTGAKPGVTRALSSRIKVLDVPPVYLVDTPGVMAPHIADPETAVRVALTGGISDDVADHTVLADYLLFRLNRFASDYSAVLRIDHPTDDVNELAAMLAVRIGALLKGGALDTEKALRYFLRCYREG